MTPERAATIVLGWVRAYTRRLPRAVSERRRAELGSDVHDHVAHQRAAGVTDRRIAIEVLSRMLRGLAADAARRRCHARPTSSSSWRRAFRRAAAVTALLLAVPLIAMQLTTDVVWTAADFAVAGLLLGGTVLAQQLLAGRRGSLAYRAAAYLALGATLMLVWASLAVGVIGAEGDSADLMYGAVLAVGAVGACASRLRPRGMARTLLAMAATQGLVAVAALILGEHHSPVSSVSEILGVNVFFAALFVASAWLFRLAARQDTPPPAAQPAR